MMACNRKDIFATQLLRVNGGQLGYSAYSDSLGNTIESHGFGGGAYASGSDQETLALGQEGGRLATDGSALPSIGRLLSHHTDGSKDGSANFCSKNL